MTDAQPAQDWSPADWLDELKAKLEVAGRGYMTRVEVENASTQHPNLPGIRLTRTSLAMLAVGTVMNKLAELPGMSEHIGLVPLHDLVAALWDLGNGGRPSLLQPTSGVGKGTERVGHQWIRQHALLWIAILEGSGMKGRPACRYVAELLTEQGHTGRKNHDGPKGVSEGTVMHWRDRSRQREFRDRDPRTEAFLKRNLARLKQMPDWPFTSVRALQVVRDMAVSPLVRSKSDNPSTQSDDRSD